VGVATDAGQEAPLRRVKEGRDGGHDGARNGTGEDAVVSVGDTDGTGVGDQTGLLLGKQEEEAVIEAGGGSEAAGEGTEDAVKDGGGEVGGSTPGGEGNTIGA